MTPPKPFIAPRAAPGWFEELEHQWNRPAVITVRDLGVRFGARWRERGIPSLLSRLVGRPRGHDVWALQGVDLTVHAGECLGIVGRNGAGKTTLLRVMARLIDHDTGWIRVRGQISALLNLGVGFDARFTGRENVELVGSLMGLTRSEMRRRLPEVIEFADIGTFIDAPLRTYSSGMRARLGFATAAAMIEPHVLLLDEVMGTGDYAFRERSRERVMELVRNAHAVVIASHDMTWVSEFATYAILLDAGVIVAEGAPSAIAALHRAQSWRPPRRFACEGCDGAPPDNYCRRCGLLWRRPRDASIAQVRPAGG